MADNLKILEIIHAYLEDKDIYLVEMKVKPGNRILVFIDSDRGINIDDCSALNRYVESKLDREQEDFELEVSSAGADAPIRVNRQYKRHIGRTFNFTLTDNSTFKGILAEVLPDGLIVKTPLVYKTNSGKVQKESEEKKLTFETIKEARIELSFK